MSTNNGIITDTPGDKLAVSLNRIYAQSVVQYITDKLRDHIASYKSKNIVLDVSCPQSRGVFWDYYPQRYDVMFNVSYRCCGVAYRDVIVSMTASQPTDSNGVCILSLDSSDVRYDIINEVELDRATNNIKRAFDTWRCEYNWYDRLYYAMINNKNIQINNVVPVLLPHGTTSKNFNIAVKCSDSGKSVQCNIAISGPCSYGSDAIFSICVRILQADNDYNNDYITSNDVFKISDNLDILSVRPTTLLKQIIKKVNEVVNNRMSIFHSRNAKKVFARRLVNRASLFQ